MSLWCQWKPLSAVLAATAPPIYSISRCILNKVRKRWASLSLPYKSNHRPRSLSCLQDVPLWVRGNTSKVKLSLLPSSMNSIQECFDPVCPAGLLDFHKGSLVDGYLSKWVFFVGKNIENSCSAIMKMSLFPYANYLKSISHRLFSTCL